MLSTSSNNLIGTGSGGLVHGVNGNIVGVNDPMLAPLADYGGLTRTRIPLSNSPVRDKGNNLLAKLPFEGTDLKFDQRDEGVERADEGFRRTLDSDGNGSPIVDIGATELSRFVKVVDVEIVSNKLASYDVPGTGEQIRTVPQGTSSNGIRISFNRPVNLQPGDLSVTGSPGAATCTGCGPSTFSATWSYGSQVFALGKKTLTLSNVEFGTQALNGEWNDPNCECDVGDIFPSGDNSNGGAFIFSFTILPADVDRDNRVQFSDFVVLANNFDFPMPSLVTLHDADIDLDGQVQFSDYVIIANTFGTDLSCGCGGTSAMLAGDGSGVVIDSSQAQRQHDLALFYQLKATNPSLQVLAMGVSLLEKTWEMTGAKEDWLTIEEDLLNQMTGLDQELRTLDRQLRQASNLRRVQ